ncbi:unannotated protein [freshwater metagenome]|uniref:Unannotated protein n=1 Tax=freshwater metagenome TaxID=449393 RepID=A0A6J6HNR4_9ZZZZ
MLPVLTTSAITSATPSRIADSTAPSRGTNVAEIFASFKYLDNNSVYEVAIRLPAKSDSCHFLPTGAANLNVD